MVAEIRELLAQLNTALTANGITPFLLGIASPRELKPAPKNARFMKQETFAQMSANIAQDGNLASLPFCWYDGNAYWILSGHHRVDAARAAGVEQILFLYTDRQLSQAERVAIQLSHNALVGADNLATLKELYDVLDSIEAQQYAGLDDITIGKLEEVVPAAFQDAAVQFEEIVLLFLPEEIERLDALVEKLRAYSSHKVYAARLADWTRFWDMLLRFKQTQEIVNTATAINVMLDIVDERIVDEAR